MKRFLIFAATLTLLSFKGDDEPNTLQAWYSCGETDKEFKFAPAADGIAFVLDTNKRVKAELQYMQEKHKKQVDHFFSAAIVNSTDSMLHIGRQDGSLIMIQEAKDREGKWRPIEHWMYSWCGNSYFNPLQLKPSQAGVFAVPVYKGDFETELRLKLRTSRNYGRIYYSPSFRGRVNEARFAAEKKSSKKGSPFGANYLDE